MKPILKWAGGKTQLLPVIRERMPENYNHYFEPFVGSGALIFDMQPEHATINDFNPQLTNLYNNLKNHPVELTARINELFDEFNEANNKSEHYYRTRDRFNERIDNDDIETSALLVFINKACFNGLYRLNSKGKFNVPFAQKTRLTAPVQNIGELSEYLQNVDIHNGDFADICQNAQEGDFVYFDPPYYNTFEDYQAGGFGEDAQVRLANLFNELTERGVYCMLSNSNEQFIRDLYQNYNIQVVEVHRNINRNGNNRRGEEVLITNY